MSDPKRSLFPERDLIDHIQEQGQILDLFEETKTMNPRYVLIVTIEESGAAHVRDAGHASELERFGIKELVCEVINTAIEDTEND